MDINVLSIAAELGMYLPVPLIGYASDRFGPGCVGVLSGIMFVSGYYGASLVIEEAQERVKLMGLSSLLSPLTSSALSSTLALPTEIKEPLVSPTQFKFLTACFAAIGLATSSLHFCGVVTAAKMLPQIPGLSISGPIAAFGISCFWQAQVVGWFFTDKEQGGLVKLVPVFRSFVALYCVTGVVGYLAPKIGTFVVSSAGDGNEERIENDTFEHIEEAENLTADERRALLGSNPSNLDLNGSSYGSTIDTKKQPKPPSSSSSSLQGQKPSSLKKFFYDPTAWILFLCFVFVTGPLEMFVNDMGMIINTIPTIATPSINTISSSSSSSGGDGSISVGSHISLFSAFSTFARLAMGLISDFLEHRYISRAYLFVIILGLTSLSHFLLASGVLTLPDHPIFSIASISNGFSYGSCFTITPTLVALIWGLDHYGTYWGTFVLAPSIGATVYGYLFAVVYQNNAAGSMSKGKKGIDGLSGNGSQVYGNGIGGNGLESFGTFFGRKAGEKTVEVYNQLFSSSLSTSSSSHLQCFGVKCYQTTFIVTGLSLLFSAFLIMSVYRFSWKPKNRLTSLSRV